MGSTWFCDFTIEIKKSNMTEACHIRSSVLFMELQIAVKDIPTKS